MWKSRTAFLKVAYAPEELDFQKSRTAPLKVEYRSKELGFLGDRARLLHVAHFSKSRATLQSCVQPPKQPSSLSASSTSRGGCTRFFNVEFSERVRDFLGGALHDMCKLRTAARVSRGRAQGNQPAEVGYGPLLKSSTHPKNSACRRPVRGFWMSRTFDSRALLPKVAYFRPKSRVLRARTRPLGGPYATFGRRVLWAHTRLFGRGRAQLVKAAFGHT